MRYILSPWLFVALLVFIAGGLGYLVQLRMQEAESVRTERDRMQATFEHNIKELAQKLSASETLNADLQFLLQARMQESSQYNARVEELAASVRQLEKLSLTDRELLQKYSSVYFLNENYVPESLAQIDPRYTLRDRDEYFHTRLMPRLTAMLDEARAAGMDLAVVSAYRSFGTQADLKAQYKLTYGSGTANAFSAEQGFSEHQLGSTVDLTTSDVGGPYPAFDETPSFAWLKANAHRHGFVLSYPEGNPFFTYEPWHWRYVGVELATRLSAEHKTFYDLDQREINEYLAKIFD